MIANASFGVILAESDGKIIYANELAETLMRSGRGLSSRQSRIIATDIKTTQKLHALISAAAQPTSEMSSGGSLVLQDQNGAGAFVVHVVPISPKTVNRVLFRERFVSGLFIVDRNRGAVDRVAGFAHIFGLSPAETRVLAALISGEGLTRVVERLEMTEPTARTHLRHILAKTSTHRQAELMRLFFEVTIPGEPRETSPVRSERSPRQTQR